MAQTGDAIRSQWPICVAGVKGIWGPATLKKDRLGWESVFWAYFKGQGGRNPGRGMANLGRMIGLLSGSSGGFLSLGGSRSGFAKVGDRHLEDEGLVRIDAAASMLAVCKL